MWSACLLFSCLLFLLLKQHFCLYNVFAPLIFLVFHFGFAFGRVQTFEKDISVFIVSSFCTYTMRVVLAAKFQEMRITTHIRSSLFQSSVHVIWIFMFPFFGYII